MTLSTAFKYTTYWLFMMVTLVAPSANAHEPPEQSIFYTHETSGPDSITGLGHSFLFKFDKNLGLGFTNSLSTAQVTATDGFIEEYLAWEGSIRFGHFSKISLFVEAGLDLTELIFHDYRNSHYNYCYSDSFYDDGVFCDSDYENIDGYLGVGAGIRLNKLKIEAISRIREIDSHHFESQSEVFSGIQISISF
ncbi:hypothetical protein ACUR5C_12190 [Aliikangiella sp. IMCC44653]